MDTSKTVSLPVLPVAAAGSSRRAPSSSSPSSSSSSLSSEQLCTLMSPSVIYLTLSLLLLVAALFLQQQQHQAQRAPHSSLDRASRPPVVLPLRHHQQQRPQRPLLSSLSCPTQKLKHPLWGVAWPKEGLAPALPGGRSRSLARGGSSSSASSYSIGTSGSAMTTMTMTKQMPTMMRSMTALAGQRTPITRSVIGAASKGQRGAGGTAVDRSGDVLTPPSTKEESIRQACESVRMYLSAGAFKEAPMSNKIGGKKLKSKGAMKELLELQGKKSSGGARIALEISIEADNIDAVSEMTTSIAKTLPKPLNIRFGDKSIMERAMQRCGGEPGITLSMIMDPMEGAEKSSILIVGAQDKQLPQVVVNVQSAEKKTHVVLLNAAFTPQPPKAAKDFVDSFEIVYSVLPLQVEGFLTKAKKGAVFRVFEDPKTFFWRVFSQDDKKEWTPVGSWRVRPNGKQVEDALYSNGANDNPINKGISGFRNIFGG